MEEQRSPYLPGRLGFADEADIDEFVATLGRYERGEIDGEAWRAFRLLRGVYGQRQAGLQMLRVKIPEGILSAHQLRALAQVTRRHSDGRAHVTTRQNVQLYAMRLPEAEAAMRELAAAGLTTREACGHSVRNVTACPLAGVDPAEVFDVTPYADALTRHLLRGPRSSTLPRKFKIAFEGCHRGCVQAPINDLAFVARKDGAGRPGFLVLAAGGLSTLARSAGVLCPFLPAAQLLELADAVVRVFHREGERRNKHRARLKWVIERVGFPAFAALVEAEREAVRTEGAAPLPFDPAQPPVEPLPQRLHGDGPAAAGGDEPGLGTWRRSNVVAQRQAGYAAVLVRLTMGDLRPDQIEALARLCEGLGDGTARTTVDQNLVLRYLPIAALPEVFRRLQAADLAEPGPGALDDVVSCAGADTCALAITASRGMGRALVEHLAVRLPVLESSPQGLAGARIHISGCPNGCGQHHTAAIGLQGGLRKIGKRALPVYHLTLGGGFDSGPERETARFGRLIGKVPARRGAAVVDRLLALWQRERAGDEPLSAYLARVPVETARAALADLLAIDEKEATAEDYVDLGQDAPFVVSTGESECAA